MIGRWIYYCSIIIGMLISNAQSSDENYNGGFENIRITDSEAMKRIEVRNFSNFTSTPPLTPAVIQQGNNLFIKPKFILGSPFMSNKQGYNKNPEDVYVISKVPGVEPSVVIGKPESPQSAIFIPPMIIPAGVTANPNPPQIPFSLPNLCRSIACPPDVIPISPHSLPINPIFIKEPVRPIIAVPQPPKLPPLMLPQLPIPVIVQRAVIPIPDHRIIVSSLCPSTTKCNPPEREAPPVAGIFSDIYRKFKNMLNTSSGNDSNRDSGKDEHTSTSDLHVAYPTLCVQGIIAERFVPNIVTNDRVKVFMSPVSPSQLTHFNYYRK